MNRGHSSTLLCVSVPRACFSFTPRCSRLDGSKRLLRFPCRAGVTDLGLTPANVSGGPPKATGSLSCAVTLTINVQDVNEAPLLLSTTISVLESVGPDAVVGLLRAADPDVLNPAFSALRFSLPGAGNEDGTFVVDANTGALRVTKAGALDFEDRPSYNLAVEVTDGELSVVGSVLVTVLDVNDIEVESATMLGASNTTGGTRFIVTGRNFGPTPRKCADFGCSPASFQVSYGGFAAAGCAIASGSAAVGQGNSRLSCFTVAGYGSALAVFVRVSSGDGSSAGTSAPAPVFLSYDPPQLLLVATSTGTLGGTSGGVQFTLQGLNFGPSVAVIGGGVTVAAPTFSVTYGPDGTTYCGLACNISVPHTTIVCFTSPGVGTRHQFVVNVGRQSSPALGTLLGYDPPTVAGISGALLMQTAGNEAVVLTGTNFGGSDVSCGGGRGAADAVTVLYGPNGSEFTAVACMVVEPNVRVRAYKLR